VPRDEFFVVGGSGDPSVVLLPGWATDGRIFEGVLPGVTAVTTGPLRPEGFSARLAAFLDCAAHRPVTIVGWSLGGFLAAEFAREYPDRVRRVVLVGIRRAYPEGEVAALLRSLSTVPGGTLSGFYARCFYPSQMPAYRRFRSGLQETYLREMDLGALREGLSYLAGAKPLRRDASGVPRGDRPRGGRRDRAVRRGGRSGPGMRERDVPPAAGRGARRLPRGRISRGGRRWLTPRSCAASRRARPGTRRTRTRSGSPPSTCWRTPRRRSSRPRRGDC